VMQWGDESFVEEGVDAFEGNEKDNFFGEQKGHDEKKNHHLEHHIHHVNDAAVSSRDVSLQILYSKYIASQVGTDERMSTAQDLMAELNMRMFYDTMFVQFGMQFNVNLGAETGMLSDAQVDCYKESITHFKDVCGVKENNDYVMQHYVNFHSACAQNSLGVQEFVDAYCK